MNNTYSNLNVKNTEEAHRENVNYIFSNRVDKIIKGIYSDFATADNSNYEEHEDYINRSTYWRYLDRIQFEHWLEQEYVIFDIKQIGKGAGTIITTFETYHGDPLEPEDSHLQEIAAVIVKAIRPYIINVKRAKRRKNNAIRQSTRRNKEAIGQEIARVYEGMANQSARPGRGPANNIRKYLGVQPPIDYLRTPIQENYNRSMGNLLHKSSYYHTPRYLVRSRTRRA